MHASPSEQRLALPPDTAAPFSIDTLAPKPPSVSSTLSSVERRRF
jgi:hypothetical protein